MIGTCSVRSNVHLSVTPSVAPQLKCRLCPHEGIQECGDHTIEREGLRILESKGTGRCCYSVLLPLALIKDQRILYSFLIIILLDHYTERFPVTVRVGRETVAPTLW